MLILIFQYGEEHQPAPGHLLWRPGLGPVGARAHLQVHVVGHDRFGNQFDGEVRQEEFQPPYNPGLAMVMANPPKDSATGLSI